MADTPEVTMQMPRWKCHKTVYADKIIAIQPTESGDIWQLACGGYVPASITAEVSKRHAPLVGDYIVHYEDGYRSWSPAKAFEEGYTRIT